MNETYEITEKGKLCMDIAFLRNFNEWRRGSETEMPDPKEIGEVIDRVCDYLEKCPAKPAKK